MVHCVDVGIEATSLRSQCRYDTIRYEKHNLLQE